MNGAGVASALFFAANDGARTWTLGAWLDRRKADVDRVADRAVGQVTGAAPVILAAALQKIAAAKETDAAIVKISQEFPRHTPIPVVAAVRKALRAAGYRVQDTTSDSFAAAGFTEWLVSWRPVLLDVFDEIGMGHPMQTNEQHAAFDRAKAAGLVTGTSEGRSALTAKGRSRRDYLQSKEAEQARRSNPRRNPTISAQRPISPADYPGVFRDAGHGIPAVDDPWPDEPCPVGHPCPDTVEEVKLSDEIRALIAIRDDFEHVRKAFVQQIEALAPNAKIKSRTKTPFSMVNKLRRKRIFGANGLTDVVGTMIIEKDQAGVDRVKAKILSGALGEVQEHEDFYARPNDGYRAHHFIVKVGNFPVEVQLKTRRLAALAAGSHTPYKEGRLNAPEMLRLSGLAAAADAGDRAAAAEVDPILADERVLERRLTR